MVDTILGKLQIISSKIERRLQRKVKIRIGSENKDNFLALAEKYFDNNLTLLEESFDVINDILMAGKSINENFRCYNDALSFIIETRDDRNAVN